MPTYTYFCELHGEFDEIHSIKECLEECPHCKEEGKKPLKVIRLISGTGQFILMGSGWAKEGYS